MKNKLIATVVAGVVNEYDDYMTFEKNCTEEGLTDFIKEKFKDEDRIPDELDILESYEDYSFSQRASRLANIESIIEAGNYGSEFRNKTNTQFAMIAPCQSGKTYKAILFDETSVFTHFSSNSLKEMSKNLAEYHIDIVNHEPKFEAFSQKDSFVNNTATLMDGNKKSMKLKL
ncbi:conserved hypothetical protein [Vibrio chagasii]|nr:conserved hypothetical protein [Vibrio chagasii]